MDYRKDIDGLRAIAVLSVILYHMEINIISGGYIGVDIFFVISGYLITSIIVKNIYENKFSLLDFYNRRVRRIFPALFFVTIFTTFIYSFFALPLQFEETGTSIISIGLFISNIYFMLSTGNYFGEGVDTKPFLHTRSLSVEEQYYIFIPIILYFSYLLGKKYIKIILFLLFISSFVYSIYLVNINPNGNFTFFNIFRDTLSVSNNLNAGFYSVFSRAWELMAGGLLGIYHLNKKSVNIKFSNIIGILGIFLIIFSILFFKTDLYFPGYIAIIPIIGTILLLHTGKNKNKISKFLSSKIFSFIGKISYSLYLWHWPILVIIYYYIGKDISILFQLIILILIFITSYLSYKYIEIPFRDKNYAKKNTKKIGFIFIIFLVFIGSYIKINDGIPKRINDKVLEFSKYNSLHKKTNLCFGKEINDINKNGFCILGNKEKEPSFIILGDSHSNSFFPVIEELSLENEISGIYAGYNGCFPLIGLNTKDVKDGCLNMKKEAYKIINKNSDIKKIIIIGRWNTYLGLNNIENTKFISNSNMYNLETSRYLFVKKMNDIIENNSDKEFWIVTQVPYLKENPVDYITKQIIIGNKNSDILSSSIKDISPTKKEQLLIDATFYNIYSNINSLNIITPTETICNNVEYCNYYNKKGDILYKDKNHLNIYGADFLKPSFNIFFTTK